MQTYQPGERIINNKYIVEKLLGKGAFGEVYLCKHLDLQVWRAIKLVHRGLPGLGSTIYDDILQRFQQEARIGARIKHDNIIQVFDFEQIDDSLFLVLEYAAGGSLLDRIELMRQSGNWLDDAEVIRIGSGVAQGLAELHELQIVHRDLKPSNILLGKDDTIKIADLGLAQIPGGMSQRSRLSSMVMMQPHPGTPDYMSPEQREKFSALQPPSDVYALGVVLFELLTGRNPYYEEPDCKVSNFRSIDLALEGLIQRMLKENPRDRPWNGKRLQEEFQAFSKTMFPKNKVDSALIDEENKKILRYKTENEKQKDKQPFRPKAETNIEVFPSNSGKANQNLDMEGRQNSPEMPISILKDQPFREEPQAARIKTIDLGAGIQMEFVYVPAGEFWMGADESDEDAYEDEKPKHKVYLDAYWIGKYPVTNLQYACFVKDTNQKTPEHWKNGQIPNKKEDHPVVYVSWHDAESFTKWISKECSISVKLPTEAQWEKAARGTDGRKYPWGNEAPNKSLLNYKYLIKDTAAAINYPNGGSPYGVKEMAGNVWEWVGDWYGGDFYSVSPALNPTGPTKGSIRVLRGGSWRDSEGFVRSSGRDGSGPGDSGDSGGFRCVLNEASS